MYILNTTNINWKRWINHPRFSNINPSTLKRYQFSKLMENHNSRDAETLPIRKLFKYSLGKHKRESMKIGISISPRKRWDRILFLLGPTVRLPKPLTGVEPHGKLRAFILPRFVHLQLCYVEEDSSWRLAQDVILGKKVEIRKVAFFQKNWHLFFSRKKDRLVKAKQSSQHDFWNLSWHVATAAFYF